MHGLTIGQVFVLFEGMTRYIVLTSPFGGGDESSSGTPMRGPVREHIGKDQPGALNTGLSSALGPVQKITRDQVPDDIRDLLG